MTDVVCKLKQDTPDDPEYSFYCPACQTHHWFKTTGKNPRWTWNGDMKQPTVRPSIKTWGRDWVCHFFIRQGKIEYCPDSTHPFAGQTVSMEPEK